MKQNSKIVRDKGKNDISKANHKNHNFGRIEVR